MKKLKLLIPLAFVCGSFTVSAQSYFTAEIPDIVRYKVTEDVKYGEGAVLIDGKESMKDLVMDVYYPTSEADGPRASVILTHGGSWHRGHPRVPYVGLGSQSTTMSQYAMRYAQEGYVAFTIRYRVATDNPANAPYEGFTEDDLETDFFNTPQAIAQGNVIRAQMGLEMFTNDNVVDIMKSAVIASAEDLRTAIRHVKDASDQYNIDPEKIALAGFSAGAATSINVAYGMQEEVAAVVVNSGYPTVFNMEKLMTSAEGMPPALIFLAQNDYPVVDMEIKPFLKHLDNLGAEYDFNWIPGLGHFYPSGSTSLGSDGSQMSIEQRSLQFLNDKLRN
ncbi:alpha/beta hydrolase [Vibrio methylphosphonaticus]|uniref:alpha/beta hydrolase n=1 Tax=Vibrio methylphosphonaticus TaxID=2946866 RepID=UPI00202A8382|nr:dienelactone hydrolase family protein [Vibrio methylphosphonaticus]MCL9777553.1 dienelactone hydrolase family protein [Vibrio methylphosphonaticus]